MGLIDGMAWGLGAAADVGAAGLMDAYKSQIEQDRQAAIATLQSNLGIQAHATNLAADAAAVSTAREAAVRRVNDASSGLINTAKLNKINSTFDLENDDGTTSPAKTLDEIDNPEVLNDPKVQLSQREINALRDQAAEQTGDINPAAAAGLHSKDDIAQMRAESFRDRTEMMSQLQQMKSDTALQIAEGKLQAAREKAASGKIDTATGRMLITSYDADIRASTSMLNMVTGQLKAMIPTQKNAADIKLLTDQANQYRAEIKAAQANKIGFFKSMGYPAGEFSAQPSSADTSTLPPGAVQIGTSGGKPVYQTPDGNKFVQQ